MVKKFKEIKFENKNSKESRFDIVQFEELLKRKPMDHSQFEFHKLSFYVFFLCTKNKGLYNINFKDYTFQKGTLFTLRKDNIHKFYESNAEGLLLLFTEDFILSHANPTESAKTFLLFNELLASPKTQLDDSKYNELMELISLIKQEYFDVRDDYSVNIIRNLIQVIIGKLYRAKSKDQLDLANRKYLKLFLDLQDRIEQECLSNKQVSYYAKSLGVTSKTLNNVTQSILHKSTKALINDIVIIQSKRMIINSEASLTEIAYQVGFDEPTNFFKYFRKYTGVSPSQFRTQYRSKG